MHWHATDLSADVLAATEENQFLNIHVVSGDHDIVEVGVVILLQGVPPPEVDHEVVVSSRATCGAPPLPSRSRLCLESNIIDVVFIPSGNGHQGFNGASSGVQSDH